MFVRTTISTLHSAKAARLTHLGLQLLRILNRLQMGHGLLSGGVWLLCRLWRRAAHTLQSGLLTRAHQLLLLLLQLIGPTRVDPRRTS